MVSKGVFNISGKGLFGFVHLFPLVPSNDDYWVQLDGLPISTLWQHLFTVRSSFKSYHTCRSNAVVCLWTPWKNMILMSKSFHWFVGFFRLKSCMSISVKSCFIWTFAKKCRGDPIALLGLRSTTLHQMCLFWKGKDIFFQGALETPGGVGKLCKPWFCSCLGVIASQLDAETIYIPHNMYCSRWYPKLAGWPHDHSIIID